MPNGVRRALCFGFVLAAAAVLTAGCDRDSSEKKVKIGFIVKQPEESWFRAEWKFAQEAADKNGFELIKVGAATADEVRQQIDGLAINGAKGFVICTPDENLGPMIVKQAEKHGMKFMSVDDQFKDKDGGFMTEVRHVGIAARKIGEQVGRALYDEMRKRGWKPEETGACVVTFKDLDTARERTDGATDALAAAGFPKERIFAAFQKAQSVESARDAANDLLANHAEVKNWLVCGMNDLTVIGAVRAMKLAGKGKESVVAIGINGTDIQAELGKDNAFFGSMLLQPRKHGYDTAVMVYKWVTEGVEPPSDTRTTAILIHRDNYETELKGQGLWKP